MILVITYIMIWDVSCLKSKKKSFPFSLLTCHRVCICSLMPHSLRKLLRSGQNPSGTQGPVL